MIQSRQIFPILRTKSRLGVALLALGILGLVTSESAHAGAADVIRRFSRGGPSYYQTKMAQLYQTSLYPYSYQNRVYRSAFRTGYCGPGYPQYGFGFPYRPYCYAPQFCGTYGYYPYRTFYNYRRPLLYNNFFISGRYGFGYGGAGYFGYRNVGYVPYARPYYYTPNIGVLPVGYTNNSSSNTNVYQFAADRSYGVSPNLQGYLNQLLQENRQLREQLTGNFNGSTTNPAGAGNVRLPMNPRDDKIDQRLTDLQRLADQQQAKDLVRSGRRLFEAGLYTKAAGRFRDALAARPDTSTHMMLAQALFASGKYPAAVAEIKKGLALNTDWLEAEVDLRSLYGEPKDFMPQLAHLAHDLKENPLDRESLFLLGFELFVSGQRQKAKVLLEQAARLEPDDRHLKPFFDYYARRPDQIPAGAGAAGNAPKAGQAPAKIDPAALRPPGIQLPEDK